MAEITQFIRTAGKGVVHILRQQHGTDRQVGRRQCFRQTHGSWTNTKCLSAEGLTGTPKTTNYFIINKYDVVLLQQLRYPRQIVFGGHHHATSALDRLGDKGRNGLRTFLQNQLLKFG